MTGIDLAKALSAPPAPPAVRRNLAAVPKAGEPGTWTWDGATGVVNTPPLADRPTTWDEYLTDAGLNPDEVEVIEPVEIRGWDGLGRDADGTTGVRRLHYYKLRVRLRRPGPSIDDLIRHVGRRKTRPARKSSDVVDGVFSVDLGDLQLGKVDGDSVEGTVTRVTDGLDDAARQLRALRRGGLRIDDVKIAWLGDCTEGFVSQGGANAWRTILTQTEQIRLLRRIMLYAVDTFAPIADKVTQLAVPGNHDQAVRVGGKGVTRYDDSFDVDALAAVAEALALNPAVYGHVSTYTPAPDELTVTLDVGGTIVAHAHGHMWPPGKALTWWQGQAFGDQQVGRADVLFSAHSHHFALVESGGGKLGERVRTWVQVPALESESTWWRHRKGVSGSPGVLTSVLSGGVVGHLHVSRGSDAAA